MRDLDTARLTIRDACGLADLNPSTGRSWFQKGWLSLWSSDRKAAVAGATTLISERSVLALVIASRLVRLGLHPQRSCSAARHFIGIGSSLEGFERDPGELFSGQDVFTALVVYESGANAVLPIRRKEKGGLGLIELHFPTAAASDVNGRQELAVSLLVDFIVKQVEIGIDDLGIQRPTNSGGGVE